MSSKVYNKPSETDKCEDETAMKRRKKLTEKDDGESPKQIILPQKKRVLPNTDNTNPAKKNVKSQSNTSEDQVDDETLIRETEAALKSLSGSWPGPRGSTYSKNINDESPPFENLFEEKKSNPKLSPSTSTTSSNTSDSSCSLKDVITLRDTHTDDKTNFKNEAKSQSSQSKTKRAEKVTELENLLKIENECASIQYSDLKTKPKETKIKVEGSYEPPDFNELVDDSSNELEIDMSEQAEKADEAEDKKEVKKIEIKQERYDRTPPQTQPFAPYSTTPTFSATSAFKPPSETKRNMNLPPLGPFPAEATFVGYPGPIPETTQPQEVPPEEKLRAGNLAQLKGKLAVGFIQFAHLS